jgi:hypothetical protein
MRGKGDSIERELQQEIILVEKITWRASKEKKLRKRSFIAARPNIQAIYIRLPWRPRDSRLELS